MLVPFTVDPDIFLNPYSQDELYRHVKLIELWQLHGCLVRIGSNASRSRFDEALSNAPEPIRKRWQVALKQLRKNCCVNDFYSDVQNGELNCLSRLADQVKVISLESTRAFCWGLPEDQYSLAQAKSAEICRFGHESESLAFKRAKMLVQTPISKGTPWREVWLERIEPLALESKLIMAVDRYALKTVMKPASGLERLICEISGLKKGKPRILRLITAMPQEWTLAELEACFDRIKEFQSELNGASLREVQLLVRDDRVFRDFCHHRYIRFDALQLLQLDTGLQPLAGNGVARLCVTSLHAWGEESCKDFRDAERKLETSRGRDACISFDSQANVSARR